MDMRKGAKKRSEKLVIDPMQVSEMRCENEIVREGLCRLRLARPKRRKRAV